MVWLAPGLSNEYPVCTVRPSRPGGHQERESRSMSTDERLAALEREVHLLRTRQESSELRASRFTLVDEDGNTRARLFMTREGPGLALFAENGRISIGLTVTGEGPRLTLFGDNREASAGLSLTAAGLILNDERGETRILLDANAEGAGLLLGDENGNNRISLGVARGEVGLTLMDEGGELLWSTPDSR